MYAYIEERVMNVAEYIVEHEATVRAAASKFGISKSTVHHDMQVRLKGIDADMAERVRAILDKNKSERHIRGGMATYIKYKGKTSARNSKASKKKTSKPIIIKTKKTLFCPLRSLKRYSLFFLKMHLI